jgi:hypothetical protein
MKHPLDFIPDHVRKPVFLALLFPTLGLFIVMQMLNRPLITPASPKGIVSFELARTAEQSKMIIDVWTGRITIFTDGKNYNASPPRPGDTFLYNPIPIIYAAFGLGLDYLFMPFYALTVAFGVLLAAGRHKNWLALLGAWVGWGSLAAALFDATENFALWKILLGEAGSAWPRLAAVCAMIKFGLILLGIGYVLSGALLPKSK